jgi:hypothetical protein
MRLMRVLICSSGVRVSGGISFCAAAIVIGSNLGAPVPLTPFMSKDFAGIYVLLGWDFSALFVTSVIFAGKVWAGMVLVLIWCLLHSIY